MSPRCRVCGFPQSAHVEGFPCAGFSHFTVPPPENRAATWAVHNDTRGFYFRDKTGATYAMSEERAKDCADAWSQPSYGPDTWTAVPIRLDERDAEVRRLREALEKVWRIARYDMPSDEALSEIEECAKAALGKKP